MVAFHKLVRAGLGLMVSVLVQLMSVQTITYGSCCNASVSRDDNKMMLCLTTGTKMTCAFLQVMLYHQDAEEAAGGHGQ